jgi:hypothetical protein
MRAATTRAAAGRTERTAGETERTAGETERVAGETERTAGETERAAGETERTAGRTERTAGQTERTAGQTERTAGQTERTAGDSERAAARRRERAVRGTLAAGLVLEGITVLFVPMTIARVGAGGISGVQLTLLLLLAAALFATAGLQRRRAGPVAGSVLQLAVIATGLMVPAMYFLGLLFAGVWGYLLWVRQEITRASDRTAAPGRAPRPPAP